MYFVNAEGAKIIAPDSGEQIGALLHTLIQPDGSNFPAQGW